MHHITVNLNNNNFARGGEGLGTRLANLLGKHRTAVTLVRREGERSKVEYNIIAVSPEEVRGGLELEERVVSELVKSHVW